MINRKTIPCPTPPAKRTPREQSDHTPSEAHTQPSNRRTFHSDKSKQGQSEMIGFAIILIMVVVIGVVFLSFSSNDQDLTSKNFELKSFVQSVLGYTTECENSRGDYLPLRKVMYLCGEKENCDSGENPCNIVNETLSGILKNSWRVGEDWPTKGYSIQILGLGEKKRIMNITAGNRTNRVRSSVQEFESGIRLELKVYD